MSKGEYAPTRVGLIQALVEERAKFLAAKENVTDLLNVQEKHRRQAWRQIKSEFAWTKRYPFPFSDDR